MANQRYVLEFSLQDVGSSLKAGKKDADAFRGSLESIVKLTDRAKGGGKSSWKNAAMGNNEYDIARGSAGSTGASGRDFANQARGLDGLVRLYATYAANLFAAGAAFRALSDAADTSSMIQGMNQLGAVSGLALGSIAKNLVAATDGAISMREAIEATTKGTSAGLSGKQMEQLGQVANKASKALGISMPDAISRLTRGISKLEPELLDELGLFTKIGPATENYARSIGKSVASLTDFEKRQAFANAVLKEGLDKFNSIDIPANPYDKLLASLKNLSYTALDLSNTVLVPLVNILAQNPTGLLAVLTAIGASIVKSAIPALGHYRENLKQTADQSRQAFALMYKNQQDAFGNLASDQAAMAERSFRKSKEVRDRIKDLSKEGSTFTKGTKIDYAAIASKDPFALTATEIKSLEDRARRIAASNADEAERLRKHIANLKAIRAESANIGDVAATKTIEGSEKWWSTAFANDRINKQKLESLSKQTIRSNVAETQALLGMRAAWSKLNQDVDAARKGFLEVQTGVDKAGNAITTTAPKMSLLGAITTKTSATVGMLVQKLGTTISAFGNIGAAVGAAIGVFGILDSLLTNTAKESTAFNSALDSTTESIANVDRTLAYLRKQPGIATATIQGFFALSNASQTVTDSIGTQIQATKDLLKAISASTWDTGINNIASIFKQDAASKSARTLAGSVQAQLRIFREAGLGDEAEKAFKQAIGVESLDLDTLADRFKNSTEAQDKFEKSSRILTNKLGESSSKLQDFKTAVEALGTSYDAFVQSTANNNPLFKVGENLQKLSVTMQSVASEGIDKVNAAFNHFASNPKSVAQFGSVFVEEFANIRQEFQSTVKQAADYKQQINKINDDIEKNKQLVKKGQEAYFFQRMSISLGKGAALALPELDRQKKEAEASLLKLDTTAFIQASKVFAMGAEGAFKIGAEYIEKALGDASKKSALLVAQATVSALSGAEAASRSGQLKDQEIQLQIDQIDTTIKLIRSNTDLEATIAESNAKAELAEARTSGAPSEKINLIQGKLNAATVFKELLTKSPGMIEAKDIPGYNSPRVSDANNPQNPFLKNFINNYNSLYGQQMASRTLKLGEKQANALDTEQKVNLGILANEKQLAAAKEATLQQQMAIEDSLASINTLNSASNVAEKQRLENIVLESKFKQEVAGYDTAIKNASLDKSKQGKDEVDKQIKLKNEALERQKAEKDNKGISDRIKLTAEETSNVTKLNALKQDILDQEISRKNTINTILGYNDQEILQGIINLENEKQANKFAAETKDLQDKILLLKDQIKGEDAEALNKARENVAKAQEGLGLVKARQAEEMNNKGMQDALKLLEARFSLERQLAGFKKTTGDAQDQQAEDELNYKKALGLVTDEQFAREKANLDRSRAAREYQQGLSGIDELKSKRDVLGLAVEQAGLMGNSDEEDRLYAKYLQMNSVIDAQAKSLAAVDAQKRNSIDINQKLSDKMTGFSEIVRNSFVKMGDALVTFAITGKGSFKDLINSMLEDLLRFEMSNQMKGLYSAFGGLSGMGSYLVSAFTGAPPVPSAKGSVYDTGLQTFAKGGMFTNSVVNQPTLFKFAQGTGLMGEAGPEAIMPLKRDSNGNLGVRAGNTGGKVDVVVNNYSNQPAKTKETMDSRGNRRIEVIVGDMVAGELNRVGSTTQQAMTASYGTSPLLARR